MSESRFIQLDNDMSVNSFLENIANFDTLKVIQNTINHYNSKFTDYDAETTNLSLKSIDSYDISELIKAKEDELNSLNKKINEREKKISDSDNNLVSEINLSRKKVNYY